MHVGSIEALAASDASLTQPGPDIYFEGPEKKLEVFFSAMPTKDGFRRFPPSVWSDVLSDAHCSILHSLGNEAFDAYLLSESSLFVYSHKLILKTCGATTLLLVLPKVLALAQQLGCSLSHVHYSHFRFAHPSLQPYPHSSFAEEEGAVAKLLSGRIAAISSKVLGERGGADDATRWYALCADGLDALEGATPPVSPPSVPSPPAPSPAPLAAANATSVAGGARFASLADEPPVVEVAMEGLAPSVCALFVGASHAELTGRALAQAMTSASGIGALVPDATVDDWAFEPCGYSMNALRGEYYYTVHVTPEVGFSYASFETNDPSYANDASVAAILDVFQPASCTVTLTTHGAPEASAAGGAGSGVEAPSTYSVASAWETSRLSARVQVASASYVRVGALEDEAISSADSESTAPLDETGEAGEVDGCDEEERNGGAAAKRPCVKHAAATAEEAAGSAPTSDADEEVVVGAEGRVEL